LESCTTQKDSEIREIKTQNEEMKDRLQTAEEKVSSLEGELAAAKSQITELSNKQEPAAAAGNAEGAAET
jgi:chromosome segregation ATPase